MHNVITLKSPLYVIHLHENHFSKKNAKKNKGFHALHFLAPRFGAPNFFNHLTRCTSSMKKPLFGEQSPEWNHFILQTIAL